MDAASAVGDGAIGWNSSSPAPVTVTVTEDAASFLRRTVGPQELPLDVVLPITVVYALIFVTGVIGNVAVCLVIFRHPALQTATNFYLFSLAVADLTVLVLGKDGRAGGGVGRRDGVSSRFVDLEDLSVRSCVQAPITRVCT